MSIESILDEISNLTVIELSELLKAFEEKFGVTAAAPVAVAAVVEYRGWLPLPWVLLEDLLPRQVMSHQQTNLQITGRRLYLAGFRGRGQKTLSYQIKGNRRGYYQLGPLVAETGDLFGLYRRYQVLSEPHFLLVLPEVIPLAGFEIASRRPIGEVRLTHRLFEAFVRDAEAEHIEVWQRSARRRRKKRRRPLARQLLVGRTHVRRKQP